MGKHRLAFVAFDSAKNEHAVAIADGGRSGECAIWARSTIRLTQSGSLWQSYVGNMSACIFATRLDRRDRDCIDNWRSSATSATSLRQR
jgi:hypothetical protein